MPCKGNLFIEPKLMNQPIRYEQKNNLWSFIDRFDWCVF